jgi:hypothetical protein
MNPVAQDSTVATMNPLKELLKYGQSVWLDYIRRNRWKQRLCRHSRVHAR